MTDVIQLGDWRPHEVWKTICATCGEEATTVAPVGMEWPCECSCGAWECYPKCQECGLPAVDIEVADAARSLALLGVETTEIASCHCWFEV
jgi:hypothetical protein